MRQKGALFRKPNHRATIRVTESMILMMNHRQVILKTYMLRAKFKIIGEDGHNDYAKPTVLYGLF